MGKGKRQKRGAAALRRYARDVRAIAKATGRDYAEARRLAGLVRRDGAGQLRPRDEQARAAKREIRKAQKSSRDFQKRLKHLEAEGRVAAPYEGPQPFTSSTPTTPSVPETVGPLLPVDYGTQSLFSLLEIMVRKAEQGHALAVFSPAGDFESKGGNAEEGRALHRDLYRAMDAWTAAAPKGMFPLQVGSIKMAWLFEPYWKVTADDGANISTFQYAGPTYD